jgi:hypothetical protein
MTGDELRQRIQRLDVTYSRAAQLLGLSRSGLNGQMRGDRPVSRQTAIIIDQLERGAGRVPPGRGAAGDGPADPRSGGVS